MNRIIVMITVLTIACAIGLGQTESEAIEELHKIGFVVPNWAAALAEMEVETVRRGARELHDLPMYMRLSSGAPIVNAIGDPRTVDTPDYKRTIGSHDLGRVAGRAAYYLEDAFPIILPTITETTSKVELEQIQRLAQRQFDAYHTGVMEAIIDYGIGGDVQALGDQYRDAIYAGVAPENHAYQFFPEGAAPFKQMLHEFFPIGKRLSDLESIMGGKAQSYDPKLMDRDSSNGVTGVFEYYYTSGMFGESYFFLVKNGIIQAVNVVPR